MKEKLKSIIKFKFECVKFFGMLLVVLFFTLIGPEVHERYMYDHIGNSVVKLTYSKNPRSGGTGFQVIAPSGKQYTLTNAHICKKQETLIATTQSGVKTELKVIKIDKNHDLCIAEGIPVLRGLNLASELFKHEKVYLIGHPGLRPLTLQSGRYVDNYNIKLRTRCELDLIGTKRNVETFFGLKYVFCTKSFKTQHINVIAYGGNSGSPVVDVKGDVIGVLFAGSPSQNTSTYTVPLAYVHLFLANF